MFNTFTDFVMNWYSLFVYFSFNFLFLIFIIFIFTNTLISTNNINLFVNIGCLITILTVYLFKINSGAYAGFLFLCELVSVFSLFIILSRVINNELNSKRLYIVYKNIILLIYFVLFLFIFKLLNNNFSPAVKTGFFENSLSNGNDFWSLFVLFYTNTYNFYIFITVFLILLTYHIIKIINLTKVNNLYNITKTSNLFSDFLKKLFHENNYINFKNKIVLNYFKKVC